MIGLGNIISNIRKLSKSSYFQTLYSVSKESSIKLFKNDFDLTDFQMTFLRYLNFYYNINLDISIGDIDEEVLECEIYEDSYIYYRNRKKDTEEKTSNKYNENNIEENKVGGINWVFKEPKTL